MTKVLLIILDGFGVSHWKEGNAVMNAKMPFYRQLLHKYPHTVLHAAGEYVGLLKGYIGNSEVGHLHIGAGRLVRQDLRRVFDAIKDKSFFSNRPLLKAVNHVKKTNGTLHVMGLLSDAGVHSHYDQLFAIITFAKKHNIKKLAVHAFLDGRDVPPKSAEKYLRKTEQFLGRMNKSWKIATLIGRFYAMDRDNRWRRTKKAYDTLIGGIIKKTSAISALRQSYAFGQSDEFVLPVRLTEEVIKSDDAVVFFNYRADRARQLTHAFIDGKFAHFKQKNIGNLFFVTMTNYEKDLPAQVMFPQEHVHNMLGAVVSKNGMKQFRLAETEKWAHVTFFFNGLTDKIFAGEERVLIPSPKVRTYDKTPRMSAETITDVAIKALKKDYALIVMNYANPDMVGHTGNYEQAIKANEFIDNCLKRLIPEAEREKYIIIITADHGNSEEMTHTDHTPCTSHTRNKVPFVIISENYHIRKIKDAALYHIAPTILKILGIKKPKEMGDALIEDYTV